MTFLANPHFILRISHAKTFKMKYTRCPYNDVLSNNILHIIHKVTRTYHVWFEFLWINRYLTWCTVGTDINSGSLFKWALHSLWYYISDFSYNNQVSNAESFHLNLYILLNLRPKFCQGVQESKRFCKTLLGFLRLNKFFRNI